MHSTAAKPSQRSQRNTNDNAKYHLKDNTRAASTQDVRNTRPHMHLCKDHSSTRKEFGRRTRSERAPKMGNRTRCTHQLQRSQQHH